MRWLSRLLTILSIIATVVGLTWYAIAAGCTGVLPDSGDIAGWNVMADSTHSGSMGSDTSYNVHNGAVGNMKKKGITYFARRTYKSGDKYAIVDVFKLTNKTTAENYFEKDLEQFAKTAKPLTRYSSIKNGAFVGNSHSTTRGLCQRRQYVCQVMMPGASELSDRRAARQFLRFMSTKLKPEKKKQK